MAIALSRRPRDVPVPGDSSAQEILVLVLKAFSAGCPGPPKKRARVEMVLKRKPIGPK